jgi:putative transposase
MTKKTTCVDPKLVDELLKGYKKPEDLIGESGILNQLKKALIERALSAELTTELGYEKHDPAGNNTGNSRNGHTKKTLKSNDGDLDVRIPRDRNNQFEPLLVAKQQTRFDELDRKIISLYSRGMSTRDIQEQLHELYRVDISPTLISNVTNEVLDEVKTWQSRSLDKLYPIVYFDALVIKVQEDGKVINKAFYLALGVNTDGQKELLGIWISENEGAKFWLNVLTELQNRGVDDILIACIDGLTGFPDAIEAVFPRTQIQLCIVHMHRHSLRFVSWKHRKSVASDLKLIYTAKTHCAAETALENFAQKWDKAYPTIAKSWRKHWQHIIPFFNYPDDIRRVIYTTNAIESLNMSLRKVIKNKRVFPSDDAALKQLYLALKNISKKWTMPVRNWGGAMNRFAIMFDERVTHYL